MPVNGWSARTLRNGRRGTRPAAADSKLRINKKLWGLITGLVFGGFALIRVLRHFKVGF
jgi:hypothetical protein